MRGFLSIGKLPEPILSLPKHTHEVWEIVYYIRGNGFLTIGDEGIPFGPGTMICQPPGIPHSESSGEGFTNFHLTIASAGQSLAKTAITDSEDGDLLNLLGIIYRMANLQPHNWRDVVESLVDSLGMLASTRLEAGRKSPWVRTLETILQKGVPDQGFTLAGAYSGIPLSVNHMCRLFRGETGMTPGQYLTKRRIGYAKQLLSDDYLRMVPLKAIAAMCGFEDQHYFSRVFRKEAGMSPSEWLAGGRDR